MINMGKIRNIEIEIAFAIKKKEWYHGAIFWDTIIANQDKGKNYDPVV